jgi:uncharacterized membrane protein YeiH
MQHVFEQIAVTIAAMTGVLAARGKQVDLFGVVVLALVTAFGGGTIRDVALGALPVFWVTDPSFFVNAALSAIVLFFLVRYHEPRMTVLLVADAFVLALFTIVGTRKGLAFGTAPSIAVAMGVITGVAGGMLRDLLLLEIPLVFRPQIYLYATAAFAGATVYVILNHWSRDAHLNMLVGSGTVLALRLAGIRWRLALPVFRPKDPSP